MTDDQSFTGKCPTCGQPYCADEIERLRRNVREMRSGCNILLGYVGDNRMRDILESMLELSSSALKDEP